MATASALPRVSVRPSWRAFGPGRHGALPPRARREWPDVAVLRANGQQVIEAPNYETMFEMVALNRADLFCRSLHEIAAEAAAHAHLSDLAIEPHLLLHYELPQYLHTHPSNWC